MQCKARYCREKQELRFPLKSGYFTEIRCPNLAIGSGPDPELCERCIVKASKPFRVPCQQGQYQGKVDEPYFDGSWLFGSDRFFKYHTMPGNALCEEEYARAEAAQRIARQDSEMKTKAKASSAAKAPTSPPSAVSAASAVAASSKIQAKAKGAPKSAPLPQAVELLADPLEAVEVIKIKLKKISVSDTNYFMGGPEEAVFAVQKDGSVGAKIGHWMASEEKIVHDLPQDTEEDA